MGACECIWESWPLACLSFASEGALLLKESAYTPNHVAVLQDRCLPSKLVRHTGIKCGSFPGPGIEHHIIANPYRELINPEHGDRYHEMFTDYKAVHGKEYSDEQEHVKRKTQFTHNVR